MIGAQGAYANKEFWISPYGGRNRGRWKENPNFSPYEINPGNAAVLVDVEKV